MGAARHYLHRTIKAMLPDALVHRIRAYRHAADVRKFERMAREEARRQWRSLLAGWQAQASADRPAQPAAPAGRLLVFPADPRTIAGSLGDQAMLSVVVDAARSRAPGIGIDMFCEGEGLQLAASLGFRPVPLPPPADFAAAVARLLDEGRHQAYIAVGADVIDGCYGAPYPAMMLISADLAARRGVPSSILGASFSSAPAPELQPVYQRLDPRVQLHIRDALSLRRCEAFLARGPGSAGPPTPRPLLVADAAFALRAGRPDPGALQWVREQRAAGRTVIGVNAHPLLLPRGDEAGLERVVATLADALLAVSAGHAVSWILLPHDYRDRIGDEACLRRLHDRLQAGGVASSCLLQARESAADLKALAGELDGVITGRMHLAIAALGMGVPALALTYNDKFEGLFAHFGLPASLLLPPASFDVPARLAGQVEAFLADLPALASQVRAQLPGVLELARRNLAVLDGVRE